MKAIAACIKGLEFIAQLELKEILKTKSEIIYPSRVLFDIKSDKDLAKFIYFSRSITKAYLFLDHLKFISMDEILKKIESIKFPYLKESFVVRCDRQGNHDFSSQDIERAVGELIFKKEKIKVDLNNAQTTVLIDITDNECFIGIDFTGIKLSKRDYRVKLTSNPLNPCLAYSLIRISDLNSKESLLDLSCKSGEIPIEAAQYLLQIPNCLRLNDRLLFNRLLKISFKDTTKDKKLDIYAIDSLQNNLSCSEINAKIGLVKKYIKFSRLDIEWLDTKFKKNSIDKVISFPIYPTNTLPESIIKKVYKELFYQLDFVLKKTSTVTLLSPVPELISTFAKEYKFKLEKQIEIEYLNQKFYVLVFKK